VGLVGELQQSGLLPQLRGQETVSLGQGIEGGLDKVTHSLGATGGGGKDILDSGHGQDLLGGSGSDDTSSSGGGDETDRDRSSLSGDLGGDGVGKTDLVTPVTSSDGDDSELGGDDGTTDGSGDFLSGLNTETDVSVVISNDDEGLESGSLTGTGLLLDGHDLDDLILELGAEEVIDDLVLLDGEREEVDLL